jgi:hypothetical protein
MDKKKKTKDMSLDKIRQNIFNAKTEKEKKMWQIILDRLEGKKCVK